MSNEMSSECDSLSSAKDLKYILVIILSSHDRRAKVDTEHIDLSTLALFLQTFSLKANSPYVGETYKRSAILFVEDLLVERFSNGYSLSQLSL